MKNELVNKLNEELKVEERIDIDELDKLKENPNLSLKSSPLKNHLNEDQNNCMNAILNWAYTYKGSRNENAFFSLRGPAGTGKTTVVGELVRAIDKYKYPESRICICAPTHKAKKVVLQKTKWPNGETLQSLLGLKLDTNIEDFDPNKPEFSQSGQRKIGDYSLVIIDESSMINTKLYQLILECAKGVMVLFVGDHVQLNPVKEFNVSLALTSPVNSYTLTTPARQKIGNPLLDLLNVIRNDIERNTHDYLDILKGLPRSINAEDEGYISTYDSASYSEMLKEVFSSEEFKQDKDHVRYIAWTNEAVTKTNRWIRNKVWGFTSTIDKGEMLLCYRTVIQKEEALLVNSDDYIVEDVRPYLVTDYAYPLNAILVDLRCIDTGFKTTKLVLEREQQNYLNYISVYNDHLEEARIKRGQVWSKKFYPFKDHVLITDKVEYKKLYDGQSYSLTLIVEKGDKAKETISKDLDYGYGITAHKSQGSTYNTVFVNYKDIAQIVQFSKPHERQEAETMKKRLLYVALSRASKKAFIIM